MAKLKKYIIILILISFGFLLNAQVQKPVIDTGMLGSWPTIMGDIKLSGDGCYVAYIIKNKPKGGNTLVFQAVKGNWKIERFIGGNYLSIQPFYFSCDNRHLIWQSSDSLFMESTGSDQRKLLALIQDHSFTPGKNKGSWLAWKEKNHPYNLIVYNLSNDQRRSYSHTSDAVFDEEGNNLLLEQEEPNRRYLRWVNLSGKFSERTIWEGDKESNVDNFHFDRVMERFSFLVNKQDGPSIYYYQLGRKSAREIFKESSLSQGWRINRLLGFNQTSTYLLVDIVAQNEPIYKPNPAMPAVEIWSYRDKVIHPAQVAGNQQYSYTKNGILSIPLKDNHIPATLLNPEGLKSRLIYDYCLLSSDTVPSPISTPEYWIVPTPKMWLQPLNGGKVRQLPFHGGYSGVSPGGRWLVFWVNVRGERADYYSYEIATGRIRNLTGKLPVSVAQEKIPYIDSIPVGVAGWYGEEAILVYDNYDIWMIDLTGKKESLNLTAGYGLRNCIKLRIISKNYDEKIVLKGTEELLLTGYNEQTKYNGFLKLQLLAKSGRDPLLLSMQPFSWFKNDNQVGTSATARNKGIIPIHSDNAKEQLWVLMGESATEYPNYYYTKDFKRFVPLTQLAPQKNYNWLTTEIVNWRMPDGQIGQGVLYKPEDFDSTKKYPVIFHYYERMTGWMYQFREPSYTIGKMNIPWFVSRGYLVFTPDILVYDGSKTGISSGEYAWIAVESAAEHLSERVYVDSACLGLQGHSFGGQLTLCIYTRSKRFAAAVEGAGFSDEMSTYLGFMGNTERTPIQATRELGHNLLGATPWERPELYLKNSSVWRADKIGGPLLIMHNKKDEQVPWQQGVEMYLALRRLQKPCWMLQYDHGTHALNNREAAKDYTIRMTQFFDHYLKGKPAPLWMTKGLPTRFKQVENRYELDPADKCSDDCKICNKWND